MDYTGFGELPPDDLSLRQAWANILRGLTSKDQWQQVEQGIQNVQNVAPSVGESLARGAIGQIPGTPGDISATARQFAPQTMQNVFGKRVMPTTEEILAKVPRATPTYQGSEQHEMVGQVTGPALAKLLKMGAEATKGLPVGNIIAYHGTPHEIKGAFDISKVGTGEGAQAYGHGMYFAENPEVAKSYRKQVLDANALNANSGKSYNTLQDFFDDVASNKGNLYKVDIPDEYIPTMMDWDKPLGQQSAHVKKAIESIKKRITPEMKDELGGDLNLLFGKDVTPNQFLNTLEIIHPESTVGIGEQWLNEAGVKGMRYLDNASRVKGKGTSNFVVFDPSEVKILEKNNKPVKAILEEQFNKLEK